MESLSPEGLEPSGGPAKRVDKVGAEATGTLITHRLFGRPVFFNGGAWPHNHANSARVCVSHELQFIQRFGVLTQLLPGIPKLGNLSPGKPPSLGRGIRAKRALIAGLLTYAQSFLQHRSLEM